MKHNSHGAIDIVLVTWQRPKLSYMVIDAIIENSRQGNYRLIVVDNDSESEMRSQLIDYQASGVITELILNDTNKGLEPARNQGLKLVESKYFICADNDCLPPKIDKFGFDWIDRLVYLMDKNPDYGAIACRTQVMIGSGNIFEDESLEITDFPHPGGSLRIMPTDLVRQIGGWRDDMEGRGAEERYICGELRELDFKTGFATHIKCLHLFGDKETDRWGYDKDWAPEISGHSDIYHPILEQGDNPAEIKEYIQ